MSNGEKSTRSSNDIFELRDMTFDLLREAVPSVAYNDDGKSVAAVSNLIREARQICKQLAELGNAGTLQTMSDDQLLREAERASNGKLKLAVL